MSNGNFEWDETKRQANLEKHRIDFVDAIEAFNESVFIKPDNRKDYGEERIIALGIPHSSIVNIISTKRGAKTRLISVRRANQEERETYKNVYPQARSPK